MILVLDILDVEIEAVEGAFRLYHENPPFEKAEFPDAITLRSLEEFATENECDV